MEYYAKKGRWFSKKQISVLISVCIFANCLFSQRLDFGNPLDIPWKFSASFGELRANAFHAGIDFRTQQREGLPVYAVADGTLSRVVVSATGYGKALYISHADGMMTVYAHLSRFVPAIEKVVRDQHYAKESFELDFQFPERLQFKKGDLIGYSGNTGSSGGPHLHFEIRNRGGENAMNPSQFGYTIKDNIPPIISTFAVYPHGQLSLVNGQQTPLHLPVDCKGTNCSINLDTIRIFGQFAFGIEAIDKINDDRSILGLYTMQVFVDDELKFAWRLDAMPFSHMRFHNAFIDYAHLDSTGKRIQWTYVLPGNRLNIYEKIDHRGLFSFLKNGVHNLRIEAADFARNTSVLNVVLLVDDEMKPIENERLHAEKVDHRRFFSHAVSNTFETKEIRVVIPPMALYEPIYFEYHVDSSSDSRIFSNIHHVHRSGTPVHINYSLNIKPIGLPKNLGNKALIASWDVKNQQWVAEGGRFNNGFVSHNIRKFSIFAVCIDTTPPTIRPVDIQNNRVPTSQNVLTFRIDDDFSGIETYRATINERWFLMEYDAKTKTLKGTIDPKLPKGEHDFKLTVTDKMNNRTTYQAKIIR
ncbi:MAG: M23 family metallopeptidase [Bacteroidales bacterium]|nr:M23 family metallopeptidase [Bacteroidales bacterium]